MLSFRWALNIYITFLTIHIHCDFANPGIFVSGRIVNRNADDNAGTVKDVQSSQSENSHDFHQEFHNQFEKYPQQKYTKICQEDILQQIKHLHTVNICPKIAKILLYLVKNLVVSTVRQKTLKF